MPNKTLAFFLGLTLAGPASAGAQDTRLPGGELSIGIRQVETGDFREALVTLDRVLERLWSEAGKAADRARAHLYLGIAYLGLNRPEAARISFQHALADVPDLGPTSDEFPPHVITAFDEARAALLAGDGPPIIEHRPVGCVVAVRFPRIAARFERSEVVGARISFRAADTSAWYFVTMRSEGTSFAGALPMPELTTKAVQYYVSAVDRSSRQSRTETYSPDVVGVTPCPNGQPPADSGDRASIFVGVPQGAPPVPPGFLSQGIDGRIAETAVAEPETALETTGLGALPPRRRWSASWAMGTRAAGGPATRLEDAMVAARLDSPLEDLFGGPAISHPWSTEPDFLWFGSTMSIAYAVRPKLQVRIQAGGSADFGEVFGYKGPRDCCYSTVPAVFFDARASAKSLALVAAYTRAGFRIGGGPSINRLRVESSGTSLTVTQVTRPGLVLDVGLTVPERSPLFVELAFQYRYAGSMSFGPMKLTDQGRLVTTVPLTLRQAKPGEGGRE